MAPGCRLLSQPRQHRREDGVSPTDHEAQFVERCRLVGMARQVDVMAPGTEFLAFTEAIQLLCTAGPGNEGEVVEGLIKPDMALFGAILRQQWPGTVFCC